jgi:hypothetical protein
MIFFKKLLSALFIIIIISSCGLSKRIYLTPEKKIALSPREYQLRNTKLLNHIKNNKYKKGTEK